MATFAARALLMRASCGTRAQAPVRCRPATALLAGRWPSLHGAPGASAFTPRSFLGGWSGARAARRGKKKGKKRRGREAAHGQARDGELRPGEIDLRSVLRVCIVGRPNAGKSTLFNRLADRRFLGGSARSAAIVAPIAGTTRDVREGCGNVGGLLFQLVDTGGLEEADESDGNFTDIGVVRATNVAGRGGAGGIGMGGEMLRRTREAVELSHLVLFMVDLRSGLTASDERFALWLRQALTAGFDGHVLLVGNKAEGYITSSMEETIHDCAALGFGDPLLLSAQHGEGVGLLTSAIVEAAEQRAESLGLVLEPGADFAAAAAVAEEVLVQPDCGAIDGDVPGPWDDLDVDLNVDFGVNVDVDEEQLRQWEVDALEGERGHDGAGDVLDAEPTRIALVGRPNAGKSSLLNCVLGEERVLSGPMPGLTRDAVSVDWQVDGQAMRLVDTAGLRKVGKRDRSNALEGMATLQTMHAMQRAEVVVLVLDGSLRQPFGEFEQGIANKVVAEGRALALAVSKADADAFHSRSALQLADSVKGVMGYSLPEGLAHPPPVLAYSAVSGHGIVDLLKRVQVLKRRWARRVGTSTLNRWLAAILRHHPPPRSNGRETKLRYITQVKGRPPTFCIFGNTDRLPRSYVQYLRGALVKEFGMRGVPIRIFFRKPRNPFAK